MRKVGPPKKSGPRLTVNDQRLRVLIIDENSGIRQFYAEVLREWGYDVYTVGEVSLAKEIVQDSNPNCVVIDPWMEGRNMWDLLLYIKEKDPSIPVLLCLAFDIHLFDESVPDPGKLADDILWKSSSIDELLAKVARIAEMVRKEQRDEEVKT